MGSDRSADLNPNSLKDIESNIREMSKAVGQTSTIYGVGGDAPYQKANIRPSVDDLEAIVDTKEQAKAEAAWDDPAELAVHALLHRAVALEMERKGWNISSEMGSIHIKTLRMAQAAIRLIPQREPIT